MSEFSVGASIHLLVRTKIPNFHETTMIFCNFSDSLLGDCLLFIHMSCLAFWLSIMRHVCFMHPSIDHFYYV